MKHILPIVILFASLMVVQAQPLRKITYEMMVETAEKSLTNGDYVNALEYYEKAYDEKKETEMAFNVAYTHYLLKNYIRAERYFVRVMRKDRKGEFPEAKLFYGKCLKRQNKYQEAYQQLMEYARDTQDPDGKKEAMLEIRGMEKYNELPDNVEMVFKPLNAEINKAFSIYGAAEHPEDGTLYFGSFHTRKKIVLNGEEPEKENAKIYTSTRNSDGEYGEPKALGDQINRPEFSTLHPSFSADGNRLYFTRVLLDNNKVKYAQIFVSFKNGKEWGAPMALPNVNMEGVLSMHPSVGELFGREVLYFISDMPGGYGGYDIYYATIDADNTYSKPVNLGKNINTVDDELSPYYSNGELFFSTNGLPGLGGFDVFKSTWDGQKWSKAENIGKGYNSTVDDLFFSINEERNRGFLLSQRPYQGKKKLISETCCDHVFRVTTRELIINLIAEIFDEEGPLVDATVELVDLSEVDPEAPVNQSNFDKNTFNFGLDQNKPYKIIVSKKGYDPQSIEFTTAGILDDYTITKEIKLEKAAPEIQIVKINEPIRLNNIYYDYDDYKILPDAEKDLEELLVLMEKYDNMVIELSSHTDARGSKDYNLKLSQRRANSAKEWLVENGVDESRIKPVGYGESVILNQCVEGVECTDEEHRFNRRTEFKIIAGPTTIEIEKKIVPEEDGDD
jgi:peptidoglycan-associated lipoprotein